MSVCTQSANLRPIRRRALAERTKRILMLAAGCSILIAAILFAAVPDQIAPYGSKEMSAPWQQPSSEHLLGTNDMGYDVMSELIYAARPTVVIGIGSAAAALAIGALLGLLAGSGGLIGTAANGIINIFAMLPKLPVVIVMSAFLGANTASTVFLIAAFGWVGTARAVRARVSSVMQMPFVLHMRGMGYSRARILFAHVLSNLKDTASARFVTTIASCVMTEATLGFLGLGDPSSPTWGAMINTAYKQGAFLMQSYAWLLAPGIALMLLVSAFYMINFFAEHRAASVRGSALK